MVTGWGTLIKGTVSCKPVLVGLMTLPVWPFLSAASMLCTDEEKEEFWLRTVWELKN